MILNCSLVFAKSVNKTISITFDDAPRWSGSYLSGPDRAKKIVDALAKFNVQAAFFVNSKKITTNERRARVKLYDDSGHIIANHSHSHFDFNKTSSKAYIKDFETAHYQLKDYKNFKKWYRFPFLREGNTREKVDSFRSALSQFGYFNGYVTINNYDWYMESQFQKAIKSGDKIDMSLMKKYYVDTLYEAVEYYRAQSVKDSGREVAHVLLLHENDVAALFLPYLLLKLQTEGWKLVTPQKAFEDRIAKFQASHVFPFNPGRVMEIAHSKGKTKGLWHETCNEKFLDKKFNSEVLKIVN